MYIKNKNNRLAIYFFYDKNGIVDNYVPYILDDLIQFTSDIIIVCNGELKDEYRPILEKYGTLIVRENKGFDVWAYKTGMESIGWDKLADYDEVIMLNSTIMGPINSFEETFNKMDSKDIDFWGLTIYPKYNHDPFNCISYGYIPEHLQSHFIACRKSLFTSEKFKEYWNKMPMINNYNEAIGKHEAIFTKTFADAGFIWEASVDTRDLKQHSGYPLMMCPVKVIKEYGCPIFKKRSFFHNVDDFLRNTTGEQTRELYDFLEKETNYNVNFIWDTILRNYPQSTIVKNMNLTYVLPTKIQSEEKTNSKIALIIHLYFPDLLEENRKYIYAMPENADVFITTDSENKKQAILAAYDNIKNHLEVRVIKNRGRDVSSLLTGVKNVIMNYDIVCFAHDKKTAQVEPGTSGAAFAYKCFDNTLASREFVNNVIHLFDNNERLGMLCPPEPNHGIFFSTCGFEWGPNYDVTKKLAEELKLTVPISSDNPPIAPYGTMFWFRPKALKRLYDKDWEYEDFPAEPNAMDGTLLHAIERIYPFIVQEEGYYPAIVMSDRFAAIEYQNLHHYLRGYTRTAGNAGLGPYYDEIIGGLSNRLSEGNAILVDIKILIKDCIRALKRIAKKTLRLFLPRSLYDKGKKYWKENHR